MVEPPPNYRFVCTDEIIKSGDLFLPAGSVRKWQPVKHSVGDALDVYSFGRFATPIEPVEGSDKPASQCEDHW